MSEADEIETVLMDVALAAWECSGEGFNSEYHKQTPSEISNMLHEAIQPSLAALRAKLAELERERDEAHKALDACARNLGNGANTDGASHEFKLIVPTEVKLVVERLERRAQAAEADCAALREAARKVDDLTAFGLLETSEGRAALDALSAALAQPHPGQALLDRLAEAEAKLAGAMRVVEAAAWGNRIRNDRERAHGARPRKSESYFAALDNDELAATEAIEAALAAMTPDATITREDA